MYSIKDETAINNNIFEAPEEAIVVTINLVGVMGKGIALECKKRHVEVFKHYRKLCKANLFTKDKLLRQQSNGVTLILFPTKGHWRNQSNLKDILYLCSRLEKACTHWGIKSVAIPPLGLANGWLNKVDVVAISNALKSAFEHSEVSAVFYLPAKLKDLL